MRKVALMLLTLAISAVPASAKVKFGGGPVEADWDPRIHPGDHGVMSIEEFLAAGYGKMKVRRPGVANGGRDEDYINGNQTR